MPQPGKVFDQPQPQRVFVSYAHADHELCKTLCEALDSWNVTYWHDSENARIGRSLLDQLLNNVRESDILVRVCTPAAARSAWMHRELGMYLAFQKERTLRDPRSGLTVINVCFADYVVDDLDAQYIYVNAASLPTGAWLDAIRQALDVPMGWVRFANDDDSYLWWIGAYRQGYVVHAGVRPKPGDNMTLHRSTCTYVSNVGLYGKGSFTERGSIKVCATERGELERWASEQVGPGATLNDGCNCMRYGVAAQG